MSILPFTYEDHEVRIFNIDGEPWFVLADICKVLDILNVGNILARLDDDMKSSIRLTDGTPGNPNRAIVSEAGMYEVVIRSDKPHAAAFRRWITSEVLPSIRKTGSYSTTPALSEDQIVHQALQITATRVEELNARLALVEPKARAFDAWLSSNVNYAVGTVAQALAGAGAEMGRQRLFAYMDQHNWIYRHRDQWHPYQSQIETQRLAVRLGDQLNTRTGERFATVTVRITPKGAVKLATMLGVMPEIVAELLAADNEESAA